MGRFFILSTWKDRAKTGEHLSSGDFDMGQAQRSIIHPRESELGTNITGHDSREKFVGLQATKLNHERVDSIVSIGENESGKDDGMG